MFRILDLKNSLVENKAWRLIVIQIIAISKPPPSQQQKSVLVLRLNPRLHLIQTPQTQPPILTQHSPVIRLSHRLHDLLLSTPLQSRRIVVHAVTELPLVLSSPSQQLLLGLSLIVLCSLFTEEIVSVEYPVCVQENSTHPKGTNSSQPPLVGFHDEVCVVEHSRLYQKKIIFFTFNEFFISFLYFHEFIYCFNIESRKILKIFITFFLMFLK